MVSDEFILPIGVEFEGLITSDGGTYVDLRQEENALGIFSQIEGDDVGWAFVLKKLLIDGGHSLFRYQVKTGFAFELCKLLAQDVGDDLAQFSTVDVTIALRILESDFHVSGGYDQAFFVDAESSRWDS